jgi:hypothetical protein
MNCPYCKNKLDTDFYPHCFGINHYYETMSGNEMIELFDKFCFYRGEQPNRRINIGYVPIDDFEILNNKTLKEIEEIYNKLKVFE